MAKTRRRVEVEEEEVEVEEEETEERTSPARGPQPPRISITLPSRIRRKVRIAAARADMEINDWCKAVLVTAATKTVERFGMDK